MKGVILTVNQDVKIIDITHEIPPQNISSASFTLHACYKSFPQKTIFIAVVDPGVGSNRRAILVETDDYYFVAPDNGLLSFVFDQNSNFRVFELTEKKFFAEKISQTFHGRDIFAPVAAHLSKGVKPNAFGTEIKDFVYFRTAKPQKNSVNKIEAEIIHIDRFGNLITNLKEKDLPEKFLLEISTKRISKLQNGRSVYDFRKRGLFGNRRLSRFGGKFIKCENRAENFSDKNRLKNCLTLSVVKGFVIFK
jgi:S-adenosylmethionine hydrolase